MRNSVARRGDDRRVLAVREAPQLLAGARVERIRAPVLQVRFVQRREVDDVADDDRRARRSGRPRVNVQSRLARAGVEGGELPAVRADEDALPPHGRRRVDVAARRVRPQPVPARRAERVHLAVGRADVHAAVRDRGRRVEVRAAEEARLRGPLPDHVARASRCSTRDRRTRRRTDGRPHMRARP